MRMTYCRFNEKLDKIIDLFAIKGKQDKLYKRLSRLESIALSIKYIYKRLHKYKKSDYKSLYNDLEKIYADYRKERSNEIEIEVTKFFQEELPQFKADIELIPYCQNKFIIKIIAKETHKCV